MFEILDVLLNNKKYKGKKNTPKKTFRDKRAEKDQKPDGPSGETSNK